MSTEKATGRSEAADDYTFKWMACGGMPKLTTLGEYRELINWTVTEYVHSARPKFGSLDQFRREVQSWVEQVQRGEDEVSGEHKMMPSLIDAMKRKGRWRHDASDHWCDDCPR